MTTDTVTYRVIRITTTSFGEKDRVTPDTVWEGTDIRALSIEYPPSDVFGADPLGRVELEDGYIRIISKFEQLVDGEWQEIDDPRVRLTPMTELEREIDAENRRLFPGDFGLADDDQEDYDEGDYQYFCDNCRDAGCNQCDPTSEFDSQEWHDYEAKPRCCACSQVLTVSTLEEGDICKECDEYWTKHFVWWRRAMRRCGLLK